MKRQSSLRRWWVNLPISSKGLLVIALPIVGLVATFFVRLPLSAQQEETADLVARSAEVRERVERMMLSLLEAEAAARGFAITRDSALLAPLRDAQVRVPAAIDALRMLVGPDEQAVVDQVAAHARQGLELTAQLARRAAGDPEANDVYVRQLLADGKHEMDACRAAIDVLVETHRARVAESEAVLARVRQRQGPLVLATFLGGFISAAAATWLFATGIARRMGAVEANAERLARGERLKAEAASGADEIGRLDRALRRAAITIRVRDRELLSLNASLERSLHEQQILNRELEAFSYSVSHDLRAPLRSIDGFAQALREDWGDRLDEAGQDHLSRVRNAAQRMGRLIDDLLKLSRLSRAQVVRIDVDLAQIARDVAGELRERNPTRQVTWCIDDNLHAKCDPSLARIVLENLIGNAWKFTSKTADARIEFSSLPDVVPPTFVVRDNGAGFDMRYADKLFAPFQRLHGERDFPGTGIGLATVQRIVHKHGGEVRTRAEVGRGASFYFTLEPADGVAAA
jgi:signal transduction histidine kinase